MNWVAREAGRNLTSGTTHALRYSLTLFAVLAALILAEIESIDSLLVRAFDYQASGGAIMILEAPGRVDGAGCEALGSLPGVQEAGALRAQDDPLVSTVLPRGPISVYTVTDGFLHVVGADQNLEAGVILSENVSMLLGRPMGSELVTTSGTTRVRGIFAWPDDGRRPGFAHSALVPARDRDVFDQCWVTAWPLPPNLTALMHLAVLPAQDPTGRVTLSQLNTTRGVGFDGQAIFEGRVTADAWVASSLVGLVVGLSSIWVRRLELASARHVGVSRTAQHVQVLLETGIWTIASAALLVAATACALARSSGHDDATLLNAAAHIGLPGLISALLGAQVAVVATRERHMFRYFKAR